MVSNLKSEMTEAVKERIAYASAVFRAAIQILTYEQANKTAAETDPKMDFAIDQLMSSLLKANVADIAPTIKEFVATTVSNNLRVDLLLALERKIAPFTMDFNGMAVDHLAMASIYDEEDAPKIRKHNDLAYYLLDPGQNNKLGPIVDVLEHIMLHRYTPGVATSFVLFSPTPQQRQDIDHILIAKTKDFLAADKKDPKIAEKLSHLVTELEDYDSYYSLRAQLFDHRPAHGQISYIQEQIDDIAIHELIDAESDNPIVKRWGTNKDFMDAVQKAGGTAAQLLGLKPDDPHQRHLDPS